MYNIKTMDVISVIINLYDKIEFFSNVGMEKTPSKVKSCLRNFIFLVFFVVYVILLVAGALVKENLTDSVFLVASAVEIGVLTVRLIAFARNKDDIIYLIEEMTNHSIELEINNNKIVNKINKFRKFLFCVGVMNLFGISLITLLPFLSRKLVFEIWLPFEHSDKDYVFWIAYVYTTTCFCLAVLSVSTVAIIWYLFFNAVLMYEILGDEVKHFGYSNFGKGLSNNKERFHVEELKMYIIHHRNINSHVDRLRNCFSEIILFQVGTSSVLNCGIAFSLAFGSLNSPFEYVLLANILVYILADIFLILFFCNDITLKSDYLSYCIYESNWTDQSLEFRRIIITWMEMLKHPKELYVGRKFFPLNLETFSNIVNFTYRLLNILREME